MWVPVFRRNLVLNVFRPYNWPSSPRLLCTKPVSCHWFTHTRIYYLLALALCCGFLLPPKSTQHIHYTIGFYKVLNSKHTLPNRLPLHFVLNPRAFYTQSRLISSHDANYIPNVAKVKPSVHYGPSCVSFWRQEQIFPRKFSNHLPGYNVS